MPKAPREVEIIPRAAPSKIISTSLRGFGRYYYLDKSDINDYLLYFFVKNVKNRCFPL